jgi:hypothetical protein
MKTANLLDIYNEKQCNEIFIHMADNGDWEYTRLGFGEDHVGMYLVDLDDSGEQFRDKLYINEKFSVQDVLAEGVDCGVFEKYEEGDLRGTHGVRVDAAAESWATLMGRVQA